MATTRIPLIAGNWKMNLDHLQAVALVQKLAWELRDGKHDFSKAEVVVFPPFTDLRGVQTLVDADKLDIEYGAQDLSDQDSGAYTGDISGAFLAKLGVSYALMGHSERREYHHETDADVNAKVRAAIRHGLAPLLCVGEALDVRKAGGQVAHVEAQVAAALDGLTAEELDKLVIAYEPIWAIGTGETATADDAQEVLGAVRAQLAKLYSPDFAEKTRLLYGGSMKPGNAPELLAQPDVDGGLIGGASLKAEDFAAIAHAAL